MAHTLIQTTVFRPAHRSRKTSNLYQGYRVNYQNTGRLISSFKAGKQSGTDLKILEKLLKADVLVLDDFGLNNNVGSILRYHE